MDQQETLGLENLGLEKPRPPRKVRRANKRKDGHTETKAESRTLLLPELQQASGHHASDISSCDLAAVPPYQPLPIASPSNHPHWFGQDPPDALINHPVQNSVSMLGLPNVSKPVQGLTPIKGPSTLPSASAVLSVQPKLPSRGPESTVQRSSLSTKATPPLTRTAPKGRWTGPPPAASRKALSQLSNPSKATKTIDLEATPPVHLIPSPSLAASKDDLIHLPAPTPTSTYLSHTRVIPTLLSSPQRFLLVLDLNGTLLYRSRASQNYTPRPSLLKFLEYAFANHSILVWSSARPHNVKGVCAKLFSRKQREMLLGTWGRDTLGLTCAQYKARVQVYKCLDKIWGNESLQPVHPDLGAGWGPHNTLLIDDSALKASAQPFNHVEVPEFLPDGGENVANGRDVLGQVVCFLEEARKWSNVSGFVRHRPFEIDAGWHWDWQKISQARDLCKGDDTTGGLRG